MFHDYIGLQGEKNRAQAQNLMAQQQNKDTTNIGFRSIQLLKTQTLGIGSYGKVCKAKCDDLLCAAKIIHETLFNPTAQQKIIHQREHRLPFKRFEQESKVMSAIKHPNIVQYLGTHQDPETGLPVLLMELMDCSLTHFLNSLHDPVPYHIQVNFSHDITLAISYLHSNGIIHRDLSSNNVLLRGNVIAKVTDFGMAKLAGVNSQATHTSLTMVPGTGAYMPPEAVKNPPIYTAKLDCFSIGTLIIQILTQCFPDPANRQKSMRIDHPQFPSGKVYVNVSEIERRQNHIDLVDPNHPLLQIALPCLKDSDVERPSAQEVCHRVATLKETPQYTESVMSVQEKRQKQSSDNKIEREEQIRELQQLIQLKDGIIHSKEQERRELQEIIRAKDRELSQQHQTNKQTTTRFWTLRREPKQQKLPRMRSLTNVLAKLRPSMRGQPQTGTSIRPGHKPPTLVDTGVRPSLRNPPLTDTGAPKAATSRLELKWRMGKEAPREMHRGPDAVVDGDTVYFKPDRNQTIYTYNSTHETWDKLPNCPTEYCSIALVNNLLTTIGGKRDLELTNQLFSFTEDREWKEVFPPMQTKSTSSIAVVHNKQTLIVAGGWAQDNKLLRRVEVMDIATQRWSTAAELPEMFRAYSVTICGNHLYTLAKYKKSVYTCSLDDLFLSCQSRSLGERSLSLTGQAGCTVWKRVANLPVTESTCITLHGQLLAIGGWSLKRIAISEIHIYNPTSNQWESTSNMTIGRCLCFAAVLPNNRLMVMGGNTGQMVGRATDSVEIATTDIVTHL